MFDSLQYNGLFSGQVESKWRNRIMSVKTWSTYTFASCFFLVKCIISLPTNCLKGKYLCCIFSRFCMLLWDDFKNVWKAVLRKCIWASKKSKKTKKHACKEAMNLLWKISNFFRVISNFVPKRYGILWKKGIWLLSFLMFMFVIC